MPANWIIPLSLMASKKMLTNHQLPAAERRLRLPHFPGDVVAASQLVAEALAIRVDDQAADAAERLRSQELNLGLGMTGKS